MSQTIAIIYLVIIAIVIIFQFCLITGAPWGRITQGGQHDGPLPVSGRVAAGVSVFLLLFMGAGVSSAAGMMPNWPMWTAYTALAIQALSTLLNWITPSRPERLLWGPITTGMLSLAAYIIFAS